MSGINRKLLLPSIAYVETWLDFQYKNSRVPGFAVAIQQGEDLLFNKAYGLANLSTQEPLTPAHTFRIASHSKMFTATAIMLLAEQELLELDDKVIKFLPWFKSQKDPKVQALTLRQLLSHSAGIIRDGKDAQYWTTETSFPDTDTLIASVKQMELALPANDAFKYSNLGYSYLGLVIEAVTKRPYNEFVTKAIIKKLGMKATAPDLDELAHKTLATGYSRLLFNRKRAPLPHVSTNALSSATGFYATVADICRFGQALYIGNEELLTDTSKREMQRLHWKVNQEDEDYGLGLDITQVGHRRVVGHSGGFPGFITNTKIDPKDRLVICVFTNSQDGPARSLTRGVIAILNYFQTHGSKKPERPHADLARFTGRFFSPWGVDDILLVGESLIGVNPENSYPFDKPTRLQYKEKQVLKIEETSGYANQGELVRYQFDRRGKATSIIYAGSPEYPWEVYEAKLNALKD